MTARRELPVIERNRSWLCSDGARRAFRSTMSLLMLMSSLSGFGSFHPKLKASLSNILFRGLDRSIASRDGRGGDLREKVQAGKLKRFSRNSFKHASATSAS